MLTSRLYNLLLLIRCYFFSRRHGRATKVSRGGPKKILVVQLAKLGDMVCTTPMFRAIKSKYPNVRLFVAGDLVNKELLTNSADVNGYLVWNRNFKDMVKILKTENFDTAVLTGPSPEVLATLYIAEIGHIISPKLEGGYSPINTRAYRFLTRFVDTRPHKVGNYAPREYLRLLEPLAIHADNTKKNLSFSQYSGERAKEFYKKNGVEIGKDFIVGIFPSTGYKIKLWGRDRFAEVAKWLAEKHKAKIILFGSETDRKEIGEFMSFVPPELKIINAFSKFNVDELKAAISMLSLFISVDSGPIYIAEAFDIPTVDIVGPMNDLDQPPRGPKNRIVKAFRESPAITVLNTRHFDDKEAIRQSEEISVEMVIREIEELLRSIYERRS